MVVMWCIHHYLDVLVYSVGFDKHFNLSCKLWIRVCHLNCATVQSFSEEVLLSLGFILRKALSQVMSITYNSAQRLLFCVIRSERLCPTASIWHFIIKVWLSDSCLPFCQILLPLNKFPTLVKWMLGLLPDRISLFSGYSVYLEEQL